MRRDLPPGELLPGRDILGPGHFCQAALKAANRGHTDIKLRERGTKKVHIFTGGRVQVDKPKGGPAWMPDKIWKPQVKKVGVEKLE
ncbi:MAG TPA: non-histone chromosomal MC1 family protein [Methanothrix sp.]|nr:non-histone chromosomal MC1 family protein [Methanothrix sp.]